VSFDDVESALAALEARGASAFDREGCDLVRTLIARGKALPPPADVLLLERSNAHLARLGERFEAALARARERLDEAEQVRGALPEQREKLERGEFRALRRELRRLERAPVTQRERPSDRPFEVERTSAGEYLAVAAELSAQFTVARAVDEVPLYAGPYNPLRIATELLSRIGAVSSMYLTAQLKRFDELAVLLTLPEPPAAQKPLPPPPPPRRSRPSRVKRRRSAKN
jgi:hypothetical protein